MGVDLEHVDYCQVVVDVVTPSKLPILSGWGQLSWLYICTVRCCFCYWLYLYIDTHTHTHALVYLSRETPRWTALMMGDFQPSTATIRGPCFYLILFFFIAPVALIYIPWDTFFSVFLSVRFFFHYSSLPSVSLIWSFFFYDVFRYNDGLRERREPVMQSIRKAQRDETTMSNVCCARLLFKSEQQLQHQTRFHFRFVHSLLACRLADNRFDSLFSSNMVLVVIVRRCASSSSLFFTLFLSPLLLKNGRFRRRHKRSTRQDLP